MRAGEREVGSQCEGKSLAQKAAQPMGEKWEKQGARARARERQREREREREYEKYG